MPITVACRCGQRFAARDNLAGRRVKCPACGGPIAIPAPSSPLDLNDGGLDLGSVASAEQAARPASNPLGAPHATRSTASGGSNNTTLLLVVGGIGVFVVMLLIGLIVISSFTSGDDVATLDPAIESTADPY